MEGLTEFVSKSFEEKLEEKRDTFIHQSVIEDTKSLKNGHESDDSCEEVTICRDDKISMSSHLQTTKDCSSTTSTGKVFFLIINILLFRKKSGVLITQL